MAKYDQSMSNESPAEPLDLKAIRLVVLRRMFSIWALVGGPIVGIIVSDDLAHGRWSAAAFYAGAYACVIVGLMPRLFPYHVRSAIPLLTLYVVGTYEMYYHGINSAGNLFYYALVLFTCIVFGARAAVAATAVASISLCVLAYRFALEYQTQGAPESLWHYSYKECLPDVMSLCLLAAMAITFLSFLLRNLEMSLETSQRYLAEIARERNNLVRLINERDQAERQLRQAQKMEAVGQLAGGIAHDFNNLLQVVSAHTELLLRRLPPESNHHQQLQEVRKASERAAALTRQLLAYSRQQVMEPEYFSLNMLVEDLMNMLKRLLPEHIELRIDLVPDLGTVHADPGQIEQVLMNLCVNARDAMPTGGMLCIKTEDRTMDEAAAAHYPGMVPGRYAVLHVQDTGQGIAPSEQERIFEPFYTTKKIGEGTGLGLAMAYGIMKQHGGLILASSEQGKGATFSVYLPLANRPARVRPTAAVRQAPGGSETVLVAEDDEAVRELVISLLKDAGFTVLAARDGQEAVDLYRAQGDTIDLLLFDVVMPRMGGREAWEAIRSNNGSIRVLFMSGYAPDGLNGRIALDDYTGFIQKPYRSQDLLEKIRELLGRKLTPRLPATPEIEQG